MLCSKSVGHISTGCEKMTRTNKLGLLLILIVACCQSFISCEASWKPRKGSVYEGLDEFVDDSTLTRLENYLRMRDVEKRLEKLKFKNLIQSLDDRNRLEARDQTSSDQDGYQDDESDRQGDEFDAGERISDDILKKVEGVVEKRGRWQGFCFRRTRSGRRLPYICWRDSH